MFDRIINELKMFFSGDLLIAIIIALIINYFIYYLTAGLIPKSTRDGLIHWLIRAALFILTIMFINKYL